MGSWRQQGKGNHGSKTARRLETPRSPRPPKVQAPQVGSHSLEAAARFACAVLDANVRGERDAKLTYTALKYLEQNLPENV